MTLLYRSHRGHYEDSMATVREVRDLAHLVEVIREERAGWPDQDEVTAESIGVTPYHGTDARNGWDTHLVTINGRAVGYTNGPLPPPHLVGPPKADQFHTGITEPKQAPRDFSVRPYSPDEQRIVAWLSQHTPGVGAGDDPIGFLLAFYTYMRDGLLAENRRLRDLLARYFKVLDIRLP